MSTALRVATPSIQAPFSKVHNDDQSNVISLPNMTSLDRLHSTMEALLGQAQSKVQDLYGYSPERDAWFSGQIIEEIYKGLWDAFSEKENEHYANDDLYRQLILNERQALSVVMAQNMVPVKGRCAPAETAISEITKYGSLETAKIEEIKSAKAEVLDPTVTASLG